MREAAMTKDTKYLYTLTPEDECAKHGKEWIFRKKVLKPTEPGRHMIILNEHLYICVACLMDTAEEYKEAKKAVDTTEKCLNDLTSLWIDKLKR